MLLMMIMTLFHQATAESTEETTAHYFNSVFSRLIILQCLFYIFDIQHVFKTGENQAYLNEYLPTNIDPTSNHIGSYHLSSF